jgi:hypothetical protein
MNRKYEVTEEYGDSDVTVGDRYMKIRHIEKRYSCYNLNQDRKIERMKEAITIICEKGKVHFLVNTIKTEKHTNNGISSNKNRLFTRCLMKENQTSQIVQAGESAKENFME